MEKIRQVMALNKNSLFDGNDRDKVGRNLIYDENLEDDESEPQYYTPANVFTESIAKTKSKHRNSESDLLPKSLESIYMQESLVEIQGLTTQTQVKSIENSKRAFEISSASTKSLEVSL